jgi:pilin isopeptide linkage protein
MTPVDNKDNVYTDADYTEKITDEGVNVTIKGSGTFNFPEVYFKEAGKYTFSVNENDLADGSTGYTKDPSVYTVTIVVGQNPDDNSLYVVSTTVTKNEETVEGGTSFNNTLSMNGELNLQIKKTVNLRTKAVSEGEFSFIVSDEDGNTINGDDGNALVFKTEAGGVVNISFPIDQDDIGTKMYVISEVVPSSANASTKLDSKTGIVYTGTPVVAEVTIKDSGGSVTATSVTYPYATKDADGYALMTNSYQATGSLTLTGQKNLLLQNDSSKKQTVSAGEFNFVVKNSNGKEVATGTTAAGGAITFTPITYDQTDIGKTYTYTISEVSGSELFVEYSAQPVTVTVTITDNGNGTLTATPTYSGSDTTKAVFTNNQTAVIPTGVSMDVLPFALVVVIAGGLGALQVTRKWKNNYKNTRR